MKDNQLQYEYIAASRRSITPKGRGYGCFLACLHKGDERNRTGQDMTRARIPRCLNTAYRELSTITKWATTWPASSSSFESR